MKATNGEVEEGAASYDNICWLNEAPAQVAHINLENIFSAKVSACGAGVGG